MGQERELAHSYRERAEELRIIAEADKSTSASESLVKTAQSYERLAANLDAIAARNGEKASCENSNSDTTRHGINVLDLRPAE